MNVEPGGSSPLPANISNSLACEMPSPPGTREDELFIRAAAKSLKEAKRCWRYANSPSLGSLAEEVNLASVIECLDVLPTDNRDLRNSATQEIRALDQDVIALGVAVEVSCSSDGRKQQADLLLVQREHGLLGMKQRATRHRVARHPRNR